MKILVVKYALFLLALAFSATHTFAASYAEVLNGEYQNDPFFANNSTSLFDDSYLDTNGINISKDASVSTNTVQGDLIATDSGDETIFYVVK